MIEKPEDDLSESQAGQRLAEMQDFFDQFNRSIKTISLYQHNTAHYAEYLERSYQQLNEMLDKYDSITWKVNQLGFTYQDVTVYEDDATDQNVAHKFYRDGVRILIFRQGLTAEELLDFVLICMANFRSAEYMYDDMVSLMWKQEFTHLEYVVVETFSVAGESQEDAKQEVDKIVNYLYERLTSDTDDRFSFARISLEDLDIELDDVEQAKGVVIKGNPATEEEKERIGQQLEEEEENRALPKLVVILFKVLEEELDQEISQSLEEVFIQLLDSFLIHEDFRGINHMVRKFHSLSRKKIPPETQERIEKIVETFTAKMGEEERIGRLAEVLDASNEINDPMEVHQYLSRLDPSAILPLLQALEGMSNLAPRRLICDGLSVMGEDQLDVFVRRLNSKKANLVRDMLYIIDKLNPPDKLRLIAGGLKHPNLAIRLEALNTIGSSGDESCRSYLLQALKDPDAHMRITAAKLLPNFDLSQATRILLRIVQGAGFTKRTPQEQVAIYSALAMTGTEEAMKQFSEQLRSTGFLSKKKRLDQKRIVISGLANSGSIAAFKLLKAEMELGIKEVEIQAMAERASTKLRKKLLGKQ